MNLDPVGDRLHGEGFQVPRTTTQEALLVVDDGLRYVEKGASTLLDRMDQPARRLDLLR